MKLMKGSESWAVTAEQAAARNGWRAGHELALRLAMEAVMRGRMPDARMCHEMVMGASPAASRSAGGPTTTVKASESGCARSTGAARPSASAASPDRIDGRTPEWGRP